MCIICILSGLSNEDHSTPDINDLKKKLVKLVEARKPINDEICKIIEKRDYMKNVKDLSGLEALQDEMNSVGNKAMNIAMETEMVMHQMISIENLNYQFN